jgi:SsrA-binding protein
MGLRQEIMKILTKNKKAFYDYEILEQFEAGIVLTGSEVKSIRNGQINLKGSFVSTDGKELWLEKTHISKYKKSGDANYQPERTRKLLLNKTQIAKMAGHLNEKGVTVIPLQVYLKGGLIKVMIGLCRGKKKYDKREKIKERSMRREADKALKAMSRRR